MSLPTSGKRELTVYDTPESRSPEDKARDDAKDVVAHPFLYYLGQLVPGLIPAQPAPAEAGEALQVAAGISAERAGLWASGAANGLLEGAPEVPRDTPDLPAPIAGIPPPPQVPAQPAKPVEEAAPTAPVAPVEVPRVVFGHVDRMVQNGVPATTLTFQLKPEHLGKVELAFTYAQQKVTVNVVAATQQAKEQLDLQLGQIRQILHAHKLPTGDMKVVVAGDAGSPRGGHTDQDPGQQPQRYRRRRRPSSLDDAIGGV